MLVARPKSPQFRRVSSPIFDYEREQTLKRQTYGSKFPYVVSVADGTPERTAHGTPGRDERKAWCYSARLRGLWMTVDTYRSRDYYFSSEQDALLFVMTFGGDYINQEGTNDNA